MDPVNFAGPLLAQPQATDLERGLSRAVAVVLQDELGMALEDLRNYGVAWLGRDEVVERFIKQDGLVVLKRPNTGPLLMRVIYQNWLALGSERGLGFLQFVLQMLWPDQWQVVRLWHSVATVNRYPLDVVEQEGAGKFLTSRIRVYLPDDADRAELAEIAPVLRRLVPAHVVPEIALAVFSDAMQVGVAVAMSRYEVANLSPF